MPTRRAVVEFTVFLLLLTCGGAFGLDELGQNMDVERVTPDEEMYRRYPYLSRACGVNTVYAMMQLRGINVDRNDIMEAIPVCEKGTSLFDVAQGASRLGLPAAVKSGSIHSILKGDSRGRIVFVLESGAEPLRQISNLADAPMGHFLTVVGYDSEANRIVTIDGSYGDIRRFSLKRFGEIWTGYYVQPFPNQSSLFDVLTNNPYLPAGSLGLACLILMSQIGFWRNRRKAAGVGQQ